ncbi:MAG TPA: hypothetical protein VE377_12460 [Candidatus Dormibacteraeota bacterium]|nr:hypothetical protein [Candidatus Dormibacteraeota bacterium]
MIHRTVVPSLILSVFCSAALFGQQGAAPVAAPVAEPEFPVMLQQNVTAGKTPVGFKIQAKLSIATLMGGTVIPRNATLSGEVIESIAKTATDPSRLAIRMDSVQWKNGSVPVKVFITDWYYPTISEAGQNLQYGPPQPANRTWNGQGQYPDPNSKVYRPFPSDGTEQSSSVPATPSSTTSNHKTQMKDIQAERSGDGTIALTSKHANIKLEKYTTYVLSAGDLVPQK